WERGRETTRECDTSIRNPQSTIGSPSPLPKWRWGESRFSGEINRKRRSFAQGRFHFNPSAMRAGDAPYRRKAQTSALGPRGEERIENALQIRFADAAAIV